MTSKWVASLLLLATLPLSVAPAWDRPEEWSVRTDIARVFPSRDGALFLLHPDSGQVELHRPTHHETFVLPESLRDGLESLALDSRGGIWVFTDRFQKLQTAFRIGGHWTFTDGSANGPTPYQDVALALQDARRQYGGPFEVGRPEDDVFPAMDADGRIVFRNERDRVCVFQDGEWDIPGSGKELAADAPRGHPWFGDDGQVRLRGSRGIYRLPRTAIKRTWILDQPEPPGRRERAPPVQKLGLWEWCAEAPDYTWSGSGFESLLSLRGRDALRVLPNGHPLTRFRGELQSGVLPKGVWWFFGKTHTATMQFAMYTPAKPWPLRRLPDGVWRVNPQAMSLRSALGLDEAADGDLRIEIRIGDETWQELRGLPLLSPGRHPLDLRITALNPPLLHYEPEISLQYDLDVGAMVRRWTEDLGAPTFAERQAAEAALAKLRPHTRPILAAALANTDDPEVAFRLLRLLEGTP